MTSSVPCRLGHWYHLRHRTRQSQTVRRTSHISHVQWKSPEPVVNPPKTLTTRQIRPLTQAIPPPTHPSCGSTQNLPPPKFSLPSKMTSPFLQLTTLTHLTRRPLQMPRSPGDLCGGACYRP